MRYKHPRNYRNDNKSNDNRNKENQKNNIQPRNGSDKIKFVSTNVTKTNETDDNQQKKKKKDSGQIFNLFNNQKRSGSGRSGRFNRENRNNRDNRSNRDNRNNRDNRGHRYEKESIKNKSELQRLFKENKNNFNKTLIEQKNIKLPSIKKKITIYKVNEFKHETCEFCRKKITEMTTAIINENDKYFHFDCIMKDIEEKKKDLLKQTQRIVYLGNNSFGIIEEYKENGKTKFRINEKINYKNKAAI